MADLSPATLRAAARSVEWVADVSAFATLALADRACHLLWDGARRLNERAERLEQRRARASIERGQRWLDERTLFGIWTVHEVRRSGDGFEVELRRSVSGDSLEEVARTVDGDRFVADWRRFS